MKVCIAGGGKVGMYLAQSLLAHHHKVTIIEPQEALCRSLADSLDVPVVCGDAISFDTLRTADVASCDAFVAVTGNDEDNLVACQIAKREFGVDRTVARASNPKNRELLHTLGVDTVVCGTDNLSHILEREIETDRRIIRNRISKLKEDLQKIDRQMAVQRSNRGSMVRVALVGYTNVGKSTLFNKLVGARLSIVDDTPGVTRDRIYGDCEWGGRTLLLVDTGGIEPYSDDIILKQMRRQAQLAIDSADVIILVTDVRSGVVSTDREVASMLQKSGKPIVLCVNKCDTVGEPPAEYYEFYNLGLGDPIAVSSVHGMGTGDLLDAVCEYLPPAEENEEEDDTVKVAVIGKPNVGKSSLVNAILGEDRMIVSDIAGTTRDATDSYVENKYGKFVFIDTAGLRRKSRVYDSIEKYSVIRARMAVERAQVCVIMIDAVEGFTEQDSKVAGIAHELGKACIIAVNKWDAVEKDGKTMDSYRKKLMNDFSFMSYAPIIFISAKTGLRLDRLFELIKYVDDQNAMRISTGRLNDLLADATARVQPPTDKGRRLKIFYMTQASPRPPTFVCFVNRKDLFHYSYQRYIDNQIRSVFGLEGTPTRMIIRERESNKK